MKLGQNLLKISSRLSNKELLNEAEADLLQFLTLDPEYLPVLIQLAEVSTFKSDWSKALFRWERVQSITGKKCEPINLHKRLLESRVMTLRQAGKYEKAEIMLDQSYAANPPTLSIIIPIYNVELYLEECLQSVANQELKDIEVMMIDDGSTDGSAEIALSWVLRDYRFRLYQQQNHGLGYARNIGVNRSFGYYIAFMDSDDLVPKNAYKLMVNTLKRTGSDFATGKVYRLYPNGKKKHFYGSLGLHNNTILGTHVSFVKVLLKDTVAVNKVWRRDFWEKEKLYFPEGILYEDIALTIPAHVKAKSVDVLSNVVYLWRVRDEGSVSITQNIAGDVQQVTDRMWAVNQVSKFLSGLNDDQLKVEYDKLALDFDLRFFVDLLPIVDSRYRKIIFKLAREFLGSVPAKSIELCKCVNRIKYYYIESHLEQIALDFVRLENLGEIKDLPLIQKGGRFFLDVKNLGSQFADIPDSVCDMTNEINTVKTGVTDIRYNDQAVQIDGWAYIDRINIAEEEDAIISVCLVSKDQSILANLKRRSEPEITLMSKQRYNNYDWSAFTATFYFDDLKGLPNNTWNIIVSIQSKGLCMEAPLTNPLRQHIKTSHLLQLNSKSQLIIYWLAKSGLVFEVKPYL